MIVRTLAPAKINWTLEVLGRRDDGYHEIRSVMQTIELCDAVTVEASDHTELSVEGRPGAKEDDLTLKAVRALVEVVGRELPVSISLVKRIPVAAGLGGGSSDAAAVLRAVSRLYELGLAPEELAAVGAGIGSDVPFFVYGGTGLVEGRGERVTRLQDAVESWVVVVAPPIAIEEKTRRMYGALEPGDFTDGSMTEMVSGEIREGRELRAEQMYNVFEWAAYEAFEGLDGYRRALLEARAGSVHLAGAGPTLFSAVGSSREAASIAASLRRTDARVFVARTLRASDDSGPRNVAGHSYRR